MQSPSLIHHRVLHQRGSENGLVRLELHAVVNLQVVVDVQPGPVRRRLLVEAVVQVPLEHLLLLLLEPDVALDLRQQTVVDSQVAVGSAPNENVSLVGLHFVDVELVSFPEISAVEQLQLQSRIDDVAVLVTLQVDLEVILADIDQHLVVQKDKASFWNLHLIWIAHPKFLLN